MTRERLSAEERQAFKEKLSDYWKERPNSSEVIAWVEEHILTARLTAARLAATGAAIEECIGILEFHKHVGMANALRELLTPAHVSALDEERRKARLNGQADAIADIECDLRPRVIKAEAAAKRLRQALAALMREAHSYANISRFRAEDLRPEAVQPLRNAIAVADAALSAAVPDGAAKGDGR